MTISRISPILGVLAISAMCYSIHAEDNPAQAAARMALAKALFDSNAQPATNAPAAAPTAPPAAPANNGQDAKARANADKAAKAAAKAKTKQQAADAAGAKKAQQEAEKQQAAEAREAAAKAQAEREAAAREQAQQEAASRNKAQSKATASQAVHAAPQPMATTPAGGSGDNPAQAAARLALAKQLFEMNAPQNGTQNEVEIKQIPPTGTKPAETQANEAVAKPANEKKVQPAPVAVAPAPAPRNPAPVVASKAMPNSGDNYVGKELGLKQIPSPALPINTSKAARLQALLQQYKADQISPEEYHRQRAAIISEP